MIVRPESGRLVIDAPAKVNLHLEILGKRPDGYHELETLMVSVSLCDTLEFREQPSGSALRCSDPSVGEGDDNLVMRAVHLVVPGIGMPTRHRDRPDQADSCGSGAGWRLQ